MPKPARTETSKIARSDAHPPVRVWDWVVRLFHWSLVVSFATAWLTAHSSEDIHYLAGYAAAGLIALRVIWGIVGTHYARFSQFTRGPRTVLGYMKAIVTGSEARYIGHNPAGGAMVITLMAIMFMTALTGWMTTTDQFWGVEWVSHAHEWSAKAILMLVFVHLAGVAVASVRHRENLVRAMLTGRKRMAEPGDVA